MARNLPTVPWTLSFPFVTAFRLYPQLYLTPASLCFSSFYLILASRAERVRNKHLRHSFVYSIPTYKQALAAWLLDR
jgi:hypothetical protein